MEANTTMLASFDDIVFEGRNKAYGAYALRQEYNTNIKKAMAISSASIFLFFSICYIANKLRPDLVENLVPPQVEVALTLMAEPKFEKVEMPKLATEAAPQAQSTPTEAFRLIKIVEDTRPVVEDIPSQNSFETADPGLHTVAGDPAGSVLGVEDAPVGGTLGAGEEITEPFITVEQMPEFEGGLSAMYKFIGKHLHYPGAARNQGLEGNVVLSFVVSASGQISDIRVIKDIGGGAGEEAVRVVSKMPNWKPGIQNHKPVPVRFVLPFRFSLN